MNMLKLLWFWLLSWICPIPVTMYIWGGICENGWVWLGRFKGDMRSTGWRLCRGGQIGAKNLNILGEWVNTIYFGRSDWAVQ